MYHQIDQLREEIKDKDSTLIKKHCEHQDAKKEMDRIKFHEVELFDLAVSSSTQRDFTYPPRASAAMIWKKLRKGRVSSRA